MCSFDAECVLSSIDKFLVHHLGEGQGGVQGDGEDRGKERAGKDMEGREMEMHGKTTTKFNIFGIMGTLLGATALCHTFIESSFHEQHLIADSMHLS